MRKITAAMMGIFIILLMVNCAQPKPQPGERMRAVKAKLYDVERNISRMEAELGKKTGVTKATKEADLAIKKAIESDKRELRIIQEKLDSFGSSSGRALEGFISDLELSADSLVKKAGKAIDGFDGRQEE